MKKHKHPPREETLRKRELEASWEELKKKWASVPKMGSRPVRLTQQQQAQRQLDKAESHGSRYGRGPQKFMEVWSRQAGKATVAKAAFIERFGQEAWDEREAKAKEQIHTVVPLHKSNYILVTDLSLIEGMVSKSGAK